MHHARVRAFGRERVKSSRARSDDYDDDGSRSTFDLSTGCPDGRVQRLATSYSLQPSARPRFSAARRCDPLLLLLPQRHGVDEQRPDDDDQHQVVRRAPARAPLDPRPLPPRREKLAQQARRRDPPRAGPRREGLQHLQLVCRPVRGGRQGPEDVVPRSQLHRSHERHV